MRLTALLIVLTILGCALLASHQSRPLELRIDANPGVWPTNAAAARVDMVDQYSCMRLMVPYRVTNEPSKGITRT